MTKSNGYTKAIKTIGFILLPALIASSVLNILFITNVVKEDVMRIGITVVISISAIINLINLIRTFKNKSTIYKIENKTKFDKIYSKSTIVFSIIWAASFIISMFLK